MRVAIVDDNMELARQAETIVRRFFAQKKQEIDLEVYQDGNQLLAASEYNLYVLDVEMPKINGVTLAERIMERNRSAQIVFLTAHERYAYQSLQIGVFKYVLKSEAGEKLPTALERAYREYCDSREEYVFKDGRGKWRLKINDIRYLAKDQKYTVFHCVHQQASERATLEEIFGRLPQGKFVFVGRGQVVNVAHVVDLKGNILEITGGQKIAISRFYYPKAMEVLTKYLGRR